MSIVSNLSESWIDRSGKRFQNPDEFFRGKIENINVYPFWLLCKLFRSNLTLFNLDKESERLEINLSKNIYAC